VPQNFELFCSFGPYPPKEVLPEHAFVGHDLPAMVAMGLVAPTHKPVTVALVVPDVKAEGPGEDVVAERNRLVEESKQLRADNLRFAGVVKELEKARDAFKSQCDKYSELNAHLEKACEEHQKDNEALAAELKKAQDDLAAAHKDMDALLKAEPAKK
jgi:hypothetical protein